MLELEEFEETRSESKRKILDLPCDRFSFSFQLVFSMLFIIKAERNRRVVQSLRFSLMYGSFTKHMIRAMNIACLHQAAFTRNILHTHDVNLRTYIRMYGMLHMKWKVLQIL